MQQKNEQVWKKQRSRYLYESQWFSLRQDDVILPNEAEIAYTMIEHPGYTMVVPLLDDGRVVMERVYRYSVQQYLLECPSGGLDGEPPEVAARRELEEETGYLTGQLKALGSFYESSGISDALGHFFLATELSDDGQVQHEQTEQIMLDLIPLEQLYETAKRGEIPDGPSALAIMLAYNAVK